MYPDRPRHQTLIEEVRSAGARIRLIPDGDVSGVPMMLSASGIDVYMGVTVHRKRCRLVVSAVWAARCNASCLPVTQTNCAGLEQGYDMDKVLDLDDLVASEDVRRHCLTNGDLQSASITLPTARQLSLVMRGMTARCGIVSTHRLTP